jgi:hypothetical protein
VLAEEAFGGVENFLLGGPVLDHTTV